MSSVGIGDIAPDFELPALIGGVKKSFCLSDERGKKNIVLAFYPSNWEQVSDKQMVGYQVEREEFLAHHTETVGISVDSIMNTTAWEREIGPFDFPLCSDFWPHGEVCSNYGVLRHQQPWAGSSERAVFVIDKSGTIAFRKVYGLSELPEIGETLQLLHVL